MNIQNDRQIILEQAEKLNLQTKIISDLRNDLAKAEIRIKYLEDVRNALMNKNRVN